MSGRHARRAVSGLHGGSVGAHRRHWRHRQRPRRGWRRLHRRHWRRTHRGRRRLYWRHWRRAGRGRSRLCWRRGRWRRGHWRRGCWRRGCWRRGRWCWGCWCLRRRRLCLRQRSGVGGQDLHPAVHSAVGHDQCIGTQREPDLAHGLTVGRSEESADVHAALLPPMIAAIFNIRSSGISILDRIPSCGKWFFKKRASVGRKTGGTTSTETSPAASCS